MKWRIWLFIVDAAKYKWLFIVTRFSLNVAIILAWIPIKLNKLHGLKVADKHIVHTAWEKCKLEGAGTGASV
jgi:hypothetical protein